VARRGRLATAAGAGLAMVALRLREDYLAIVTLGFGEVLRLFLLKRNVAHARRQRRDRHPAPAPRAVLGHYDLFYFVLVLVVVALVYATLERLRARRSPRAPRDPRGRDRGRCRGQAVFRFKVQAFALGAGIAGLAGILFAHYLAYVEPNMFLPQESLFVWLALILGGSGNNRGALLGSVVLLGLLEGSRFAKDVIPFLTGVRLAAAQQILVGVCSSC